MALPSVILLLSVFAQVGLTLWAMVAMGRARLAVLAAKEVAISDISLGTDAYPEHIRKLQNNVRNQFELPVLFYACAAVALALDAVTWPLALLGVLFAVSRLVHRRIHVTTNHLIQRFRAFTAGMVVVTCMWLVLAATVLATM